MTPAFLAMEEDDVRRETPVEMSPEGWKKIDRRLRFLIPIGTTISVAYLLWLLLPGESATRISTEP